jgi:hypothetical protein
MAREVGAGEPNDLYGRSDYVVMTQYELERFSALIAAAEREACAAMVERGMGDWRLGKKVSAAIRARGEDKS